MREIFGKQEKQDKKPLSASDSVNTHPQMKTEKTK